MGNVVGAGLRRAVCLIARTDACPSAAAKATRLGPKPKGHHSGGPWRFLAGRAGDIADGATATAGFVGDAGVGAYDSVKGTLTLGWELSPTRATIDPDGFSRDARAFGEATWFGITHPAELGKALIDWKDLTGGHPGKALGQWLPDIALALLTGGLGTAADGGTEAARDLSRVEKAAEAARAAEDAVGSGVEFKADTSHIFRNAPGHLLEDIPANRALLQGAVKPENFVGTRGPGGAISVYREVLPDGRQVWVEVRNGTEITNGGVNPSPRP